MRTAQLNFELQIGHVLFSTGGEAWDSHAIAKDEYTWFWKFPDRPVEPGTAGSCMRTVDVGGGTSEVRTFKTFEYPDIAKQRQLFDDFVNKTDRPSVRLRLAVLVWRRRRRPRSSYPARTPRLSYKPARAASRPGTWSSRDTHTHIQRILSFPVSLLAFVSELFLISRKPVDRDAKFISKLESVIKHYTEGAASSATHTHDQ